MNTTSPFIGRDNAHQIAQRTARTVTGVTHPFPYLSFSSLVSQLSPPTNTFASCFDCITPLARDCTRP